MSAFRIRGGLANGDTRDSSAPARAALRLWSPGHRRRPSALVVAHLYTSGMNPELEKLRSIIREQYGVRCGHLRSESITDSVGGTTVWQGVVEVFKCIGGRKPVLIYAWVRNSEDGGRRYMAMLGKPPIRTALDAVRAAIAAPHQRSSS